MTLNILDTTEKKRIITEYRLRLAVVSIFAFGSLVLASSFLLIPPYVFSITKYNGAQNNIAVLEQKYGNSTKEKELAANIRDINSKVELLDGDSAGSALLPLSTISKILKLKTAAIKIDNISYDSTGNAERIVFSGLALTRDALATFVDELKNEPSFANISLPISSYVKSTNINFSIVVDGNPKVETARKPSGSSAARPF